MQTQIETAAAMEDFGRQLGLNCTAGDSVYLKGQLGAGKTTLVRGFLRAKGYLGKVKSPTYTLVEPYEMEKFDIFHFDLYRLNEPDELNYIGYRDYFDGRSIVLLEWPEKAASLLDLPDLLINIDHSTQGRALTMQAHSARGQELLLTIQ